MYFTNQGQLLDIFQARLAVVCGLSVCFEHAEQKCCIQEKVQVVRGSVHQGDA